MRINEQETEITIDALTISANIATHPDAKKQILKLKKKLEHDLSNYQICKANEVARMDEEIARLQEG